MPKGNNYIKNDKITKENSLLPLKIGFRFSKHACIKIATPFR
ncbi:hypothetical protein HMPREF1990_01837 [Porphyromonas gingivalis W4087]|nr:hypothetical protein HMPREF1990_01837 [Porphyromonas gingivalis W4087]ERJ88422.1 hypothetical protein HMPREF1989_00326 [Porphyromonas gingivalis F0566]